MDKLLTGHRCEKALKDLSEGNSGALADIYEAAGRKMFALAYSILQDYYLAEDVVQDSLISISQHAKDVRRRGSAMSWIMSIVHNTAIDLMRARRHEVFPGEFTEDFCGTQELGLSENSMMVHEALLSLDMEDRQLVLLKAVAGLSHKEISRILDISLAGCQKRYQRCLKKLKQELSK